MGGWSAQWITGFALDAHVVTTKSYDALDIFQMAKQEVGVKQPKSQLSDQILKRQDRIQAEIETRDWQLRTPTHTHKHHTQAVTWLAHQQ